MLIIPINFRLEQKQHSGRSSPHSSNSSDETLLEDAMTAFGGSLFCTPESGKAIQVLGILETTGDINWLYPSKSSRAQISILSLNPVEYCGDRIAISVEKGVFPVLAVTQSFPNSTAEFTLTYDIDEESEREMPREPPTRGKTDLFTIFYIEFYVDIGMKIQLRIKLRDKDGYVVGHLAQNFSVVK